MLTMHYGQPSYTIHNACVDVFVSVQGGHLTAAFKAGERTILPFFVAPWWQEARFEADPIIQVLRGDFFCFPFGGNDAAYQGTKHPVHGKTANACWEMSARPGPDRDLCMTLTMDLAPLAGTVEKQIRLAAQEPVIYQNHRIAGFQGKMPLGYHPSLKFPDRSGAAMIDMSPPVAGFTTPVPVETSENKGYSLLRNGVAITDRANVPACDGHAVDLTRYPLVPKGFEDIVIFMSDPSPAFAFTAAACPEDGYLYFQLKNPRVLRETLFWMSNGGRHYAPWNGRVSGVIGLEEITAFYHYGIQPSLAANFFREQGYSSYLDIEAGNPLDVKLIMGVVPISNDFSGVKNIVRKDAATITIQGKRGETLDVPCRVDFLAEG